VEMKMKINLLLRKINWEYVVLYGFYASCILIVITGYNIVRSQFEAAEEACNNRNGVLLQEKQGGFVCIKKKSIINLETNNSP
jgi:hypothetical protein